MVIKTEIYEYIVIGIAAILGLLGLNELNKKKQTQTQTPTNEAASQQNYTIKTILDYLTSIGQGQQTITGTGAGGGTGTETGGEGSIPPIYSKAASQLGVKPLDIIDISVSADNKSLLVRMKDGRTLTTQNPEYQAHMEIYEPGARTYHIKIGDEPFKITPGDYLHNPTISDRDGFENIGTGPGGFTYPDNITATSFLDWTKQKYGTASDPLGLKGYKAYAESMTHQTAKWDVVYEVQKAIVIPSQPGTQAQLTEWQTALMKMSKLDLQHQVNAYLKTGDTEKYKWALDLYNKTFNSNNIAQNIVNSGGTAINANLPTQTCTKGADGNMYCR